MDYTEDSLRQMTPQELAEAFSQVIRGWDAPLDWNTLIDPVLDLGFLYVLGAGADGFYCRMSKNGVELVDIRMPKSSTAHHTLAIATILAAQMVRG